MDTFITPERTKAGCSFGDIDMQISFNEAEIVFFGIPLELTTSFGKGTGRGPEAIRSASGRQIETYVYDEKKDINGIAKFLTWVILNCRKYEVKMNLFFPS